MSDLAIEGLTVRFGGLTALEEVSMTAARGEVVGIIGPNGAGKTTLFNAICGFVRPDEGRISLGRRAGWTAGGRAASPATASRERCRRWSCSAG